MREKVLLICEECLSRNYQTTINKDRKETLEVTHILSDASPKD